MDKVLNKQELRKAVTDFIQFEDETSLIWPWSIPADRLLEDEELLQKIVETVRFDETGNPNRIPSCVCVILRTLRKKRILSAIAVIATSSSFVFVISR